MLRKLIVWGVVAHGVLACGPTKVEKNYIYGANENGVPSGANGNYSCVDLSDVEYACLQRFAPNTQDNTKAAGFLSNYCKQCGFNQNCLSCVALAPCTQSKYGPKTPLEYCIEEGACPSVKGKDGEILCE